MRGTEGDPECNRCVQAKHFCLHVQAAAHELTHISKFGAMLLIVVSHPLTGCVFMCLLPSQQLAQLELVCQRFYESIDITVRSEAEKALVTFSDSPESLPQCQLILERSQVQMWVAIHCKCHTQYIPSDLFCHSMATPVSLYMCWT